MTAVIDAVFFCCMLNLFLTGLIGILLAKLLEQIDYKLTPPAGEDKET